MEQLGITTCAFEYTVTRYLREGWLVKHIATMEPYIYIIFERPLPTIDNE